MTHLEWPSNLSSRFLILMMLGGTCIVPLLLINSKERLPEIEADSVFERSISGGESHRYRVQMLANQSLRVIAEQRGADVELRVFDADGSLLRGYDSPKHDQGNEYGLLVSEKDGQFTLEVRSVFERSPPGDYRLWVEYFGPASDRDRHFYQGLLLDYQSYELEKDIVNQDRFLMLKRRALEHYRKAGHTRAILYSRLELAATLGRINKLDESLDQFRELLSELPDVSRSNALRVDETWVHLDWLDEANLYASLYQAIGSIYLGREAPERALGYFEAAVRVENEGRRWWIEATQMLGLAHLKMGYPRRALKGFERILSYWKKKGHKQRASLTLRDIGLAHESLGQFYKARQAYERSLELVRSNAIRPTDISFVLVDIGRMELAVGNEAKALELYEEAYHYLKGTHHNASDVLIEKAALHQAMGREQRAFDLYHQALSEAQKHATRLAEQKILYGFAELHRTGGRLNEALESTQEALRMAEIERDSNLNPNLAHRQRVQAQALYDLQIELLMALDSQNPEIGYDAQALETSERSRARDLLEILPRNQGAGAVEQELLQKHRVIEQRLDVMAEEQSRAFGGRLPSWDEAPVYHSNRLDLMNLWTEVEARILAQRTTRTKLLKLSEIRQHVLDAETLLLQYDLGERSSWLWAVTTDRLISAELPPRAEIEAIAERLYKGLTARSEYKDFETDQGLQERTEQADRQVLRAAAQLSAILLEPAAELLDRRRVVIVTDGLLQSIPFAALPRPGTFDSPEPFVVRHELVGAPSVSVLASLRTDRPNRAQTARTLVLLADPIFERSDARLVAHGLTGPDTTNIALLSPEAFPDQGRLRDLLRFSDQSASDVLVRLLGTREEAKRIAHRLPPEESLVALGLEANRDLALQDELASARIVHFASHAIAVNDYPELSGILLSQFDDTGRRVNGFLSAADIRRLELSADLVVLSACRTALGKDVHGEGLLGLHRSFMRAGAPAVLASIWSPQDRATAELMDRFYENLMEHDLNPAAALQLAQRSMWRDGYKPYHWAGFLLHGDWRALNLKVSNAR